MSCFCYPKTPLFEPRRGFLAGLTVNGGTDQNVFQVFIEQILVPSLWPGAVVVMDNLPVHKVKKIQELLESAGAKVIYLSPYSPDFNPIENRGANGVTTSVKPLWIKLLS